LIFELINYLALSPVTGAKYSNDTAAIGKTDGENAAVDLSETKIAFFGFTMSEVFGYDTAGISEGILCQRKRYSVLLRFSASLFASHSNRVFFITLSYILAQ
jgi:hypothetical protein